eukprot:4139578-Pleurochrysis_carterae.AAC.1
MDLPALMCLPQFGLDSTTQGMVFRRGQKYSVSEAGSIEWRKSPSMDTYFIENSKALAEYLSFHTRSAASGLVAYGSTKGAVVRKEGLE